MKEFRSSRLRVWENINRTMQEFKVLLLGYRSYTALLTQTGTDAPVATVLENTLGGDVVWSYVQTGFYFGTLNNSFPLEKTFCQGITTTVEDGTGLLVVTVKRNTMDEISVSSANPIFETPLDDVLLYMPIEIRVYN